MKRMIGWLVVAMAAANAVGSGARAGRQGGQRLSAEAAAVHADGPHVRRLVRRVLARRPDAGLVRRQSGCEGGSTAGL